MLMKREQEGNQDIDEESERYEDGADKYREYEEEDFGDDGNFSDIDAKFEQKLRSNQYQVTEDVFDELIGGSKSNVLSLFFNF